MPFVPLFQSWGDSLFFPARWAGLSPCAPLAHGRGEGRGGEVARWGVAGWWDGGMAGWWDGGMAGWRDGGMAGWRDGGMAGWRDGGMAVGGRGGRGVVLKLCGLLNSDRVGA